MKQPKNERTDFHQPVLVSEVLAHLKIEPGRKYVDATVGGGGHAIEIIHQGGKLLGLDVDSKALAFSRKRLVLACPPSASCWKLVQTNFAHLKSTALEEGFAQVAGVLFDLGVSSHQLTSPNRGFSFRGGDLDMRMDPELGVTAADLVNGLGKKELVSLFKRYGEEPEAVKIALAIVASRRERPITEATQLADLISRVKKERKPGRHPATRVFQALRMAVNDELNVLKEALPQAFDLLEQKGRLVVISFHSLEDGVVKTVFRDWQKAGWARIVTPKPIRPTQEEVNRNPRSRSARLRAVEKIK